MTACPTCGYVHTAADVIAVSRFTQTSGYRVRGHDRIYPTRAAAEAALCAERAERGRT
jgi:hypothetical protein